MDTKIWGIIGGVVLLLALLSPFVLSSSKKVERIFEDAEMAYEERRYEDALERYDKALKESKKLGVKTDTIVPEFQAYIHYKIAQCEQQLGNVNVALEHYRKVIVNFPESRYVTDSYVGRGDLYFDREDYEAASEEYKRALETTQDAARREQINQKYQRALTSINPPPPPPLPPNEEEVVTPDFAALTEATSLRFKERFGEAATQYKTFASNHLPVETAVYALYWAGRCYHKAGLFQQAVDAFERLIDDYAYTPNTIEAYHGLSAVYFDWGKRDEDTSKYELVIETVEKAEQEYADSRVVLDQEVLDLMKEIKCNAKAMIEPVPPPPPEEQCVRQGREHFDRGELELAEKKARKALRINSEYEPAKQLLREIKKRYCDQGREHFDRGELELAEKKARKALRINSEYEPAKQLLREIKKRYCDQGREHFDRGELELAEKKARKALRINSEYEPAKQLLREIKKRYYDQGLEALDQNDNHTAVVKFNKVIDIDSNDRKAYFYLGVAHFNLHNCVYAEDAVNNALAIDPDYKEAHRLLEQIREKENSR